MLILRYQSRTWETSGRRHSSYFHLFVTDYVFLKFLRINNLKFSKIWKWCKRLMWLWLSCVIITTYQTCRQLNFVFFSIQMHNPSYSSWVTPDPVFSCLGSCLSSVCLSFQHPYLFPLEKDVKLGERSPIQIKDSEKFTSDVCINQSTWGYPNYLWISAISATVSLC